MKKNSRVLQIFLLAAIAVFPALSFAQETRPTPTQRVRTVSIPIAIYTKEEMKQQQAEEFLAVDRLSVTENGEEQTILSIRSVTDAPLSIAILIQDDLTANFNLQLRSIRDFIRSLPQGSRVMVAYLRGGTLQIRQKFTTDREAAADALRIVFGNSSVAPRNPYDGLIDTLDRFDALPAGRRAVFMVSDGLDVSSGIDAASPGQSTDLERAIFVHSEKVWPCLRSIHRRPTPKAVINGLYRSAKVRSKRSRTKPAAEPFSKAPAHRSALIRSSNS